jgi:hypothetical protein
LAADVDEIAQFVLPCADLRLQLFQRHVRALHVLLLRVERLGEAFFVGFEILHAVKALAQLAFERCGVFFGRIGLQLGFFDIFFEFGELHLRRTRQFLRGLEAGGFLVHVRLRFHHAFFAQLVCLLQLRDLLLQFAEFLVLAVGGDVQACDELRRFLALLRQTRQHRLDACQFGVQGRNLLPQVLFLGPRLLGGGVGLGAFLLGGLLRGQRLLGTLLGVRRLRLGGFDGLGEICELRGLGFEGGFEGDDLFLQLVLVARQLRERLVLGLALRFGVLERLCGGGKTGIDIGQFREAFFGGGNAFLHALEPRFGGIGLRELCFGLRFEIGALVAEDFVEIDRLDAQCLDGGVRLLVLRESIA